MSYVTNAILTFYTFEDTEIMLKRINEFFDREYPMFTLVNNEGGTKCLDVSVATGAFNYLDENELIEHLKSIEWGEVKFAQLFLCHQDDRQFRVIEIKEGESW